MKRTNSQFTVAACVRADHGSIAKYFQNPNPRYPLILDFGYVTDSVGCSHYLRKLSSGRVPLANLYVRMMIDDPSLPERLAADNPSFNAAVVILALPLQGSPEAMAGARKLADQVFAEVYSEESALEMDRLNPDGLILRGNEAGGICSNMSNPTLLRRVRAKIAKPIWIHGGIGVQSALAHALGGADGVILSDALMLMPEREGQLKDHDIRSLKSGVRTRSIDIGNRMHIRVSEAYPELLQQIGELCVAHDRRLLEKSDVADTRIEALLSLMDKNRTRHCFMGEEIGWAEDWSATHDSIDRLMRAFEEEILGQLEILRKNYPLGRGNALAQALKAEYPILQGPMTHVSDCPDFLAAVARNGAVPFAALGLSNGAQVEQLLSQTRDKMDGRPWGVGIIGFAPKAVQDEQFEVIGRYKPDVAIVAGGRPQHYKTLRDMGILPFVHIPVPSMIASFFKEGVRHFIFEGRGCGGHIGPINSYTLWQSALIEFRKLADAGQDLTDVRIAFAGGIYDAVSAAMASAFSTPLVAHGVQFCFIVGTAYLFTREIIESHAISPVFQKVALASDNTVIMEGAAGHALRCAQTPLTFAYARKRVELINQGLPPAEVQLELENLNIGRLRLAAKGVMPAGPADSANGPVSYSEADQEKEGLYMIGEVATLLDQSITMADLHRTICAGAPGVIDEQASIAFHSVHAEKPFIEVRATDVAIVGMSAIVPEARNLDQFWHNILARLYCIRDVSEDRWHPAVNYNPDPNFKDTAYSTKGGFLGEIPINCMEWGIPPGSMAHVEPAQLLALEAVKQALADAGYETRTFDRERTSVIFGFAGGGDLLLSYSVRASLREYLHRAEDIPDDIRRKVLASVNDVLPEWSEDAFPGILGNIIAGRVANRFNFSGLNFTMDAACASSMAALKVACQELVYGTSETVIVGGVDASQHPFGYTCFSKTKALSVAGQSRPFSRDADGIVLGEGVGVVVVKRLADAIRDNDRIYAVIKGIGGASDGKGSGMTVPVARGQKLAVERAYDIAGFKTDTVDLIEAHGTGTTLGDRVELETLHEVLQQHGAVQPCAVGSIKSAIGHTKGAAGIIGVIKAGLALYHKVLPAHVNVETVHPAVSNPNTRLYINLETRPWLRKAPQRARRAGASAFGFGGANFHTVLEEFGGTADRGGSLPASIWPAELFLFGAKDTPTLIKRIDTVLASLDRSDLSLAQMAYHHHQRQMPFIAAPVRLAVRADSPVQLREKLTRGKALIADGTLQTDSEASLGAVGMGDGIWGLQRACPAEPVTALFPGQGAQKLNMLKDLALVFPIVRECLENANFVLADDFFPVAQQVLTDYIYPPVSNKDDAAKEALAALTRTTVAQPALAAVEMALYRLLMQFNVKIDMAAGHSFGELTALWAAGVLTDRQLLTLAGTRGRCMAASSDVATGMTAVQTQRDVLKAYIDGVEELTIANHNTPRQVVVSGSTSALEHFETWCREQKLGYKRLPVSQGFHSPFMAAAATQWQEALAKEKFLPTAMPVFSNMTAEPYGQTAHHITETLGHHLRNGVRFVDEIEAMHAAGARTFLEIGPGATLTNFVDAILGDKPHRAIAAQPREGKPGVAMLLDTLAALFICGHDIDLQPAFDCRVIAEAAQPPAPSATLFMVNGGRAKSTVALKGRKAAPPEPSRWAQPPKPAVPVSDPAAKLSSTGATTPQPSTQADRQRVPAVSGHPPQWPEAVSTAPASMPTAAMPILTDQEKLKKMKYFQKSMNLFLETQERFHRQRLEMMEKMWRVNQQLFQSLLGPGQQAPMPMETAIFSGPEMKIDDGGRPLPDMTPAAFFANPVPATEAPSPVAAAPGPAPLVAEPIKRPEVPVKDEKAARLDFKALLFDVISERTQYPVDMLAPEQQIEADLGIDSIKRVEIISMMQEADPCLADIGDEKYFEEMAQFKTLGDIVQWLEDHFGGRVEAAGAPSPAPAAAQAGPAAGPLDFQALLFDVISERTQYPVDMLAPEQQIEADLGIDSIKRVEIISMMQEADPCLADIGDEKYFEEMAQFKTLGDIVQWLEDHFGGRVEAAGAPSPAPAAAQAGPAAGPLDFQALLFDVISERTQYPVDMLAPEQQIEADLGIDSIKRVEIISMMQAAHPCLADIGDEKYFEEMAQFKTLGDIVQWLEDHFGGRVEAAGAPSPAPAAAQAGPAAGPLDFQALLFDVISERTQYPVDMLAPEQQIEADLGIDSIKRVEIISMMQAAHPCLADIGDEKYFEEMAQLKTLGDIVAWIEQHFGRPPSLPDYGRTAAAPSAMPEAPESGVALDLTKYGKRVVELLCERTMYPVELIGMGMSLEKELGVDARQLEEITRALADTHPAAVNSDQASLLVDPASLQTVQDLVEWAAKTLRDNAGTGLLPVTGTAEESSLFHRFQLKLVERGIDPGAAHPFHGALLLLDGGHPLGAHIQSEVVRQGGRCVRVVAGTAAAVEDESCIHLELSEEIDYQRCYQRIKKQFGPPAGVLNLLAVGKERHEDGYQAVIQSFLWAKTVGSDPALLPYDQHPFFWISVSGMGGDFGLENAMAFQACQNGLHGITKCLFHEWPGIRAKTIDIHPDGDLEQLSRSIVDECHEIHPSIKEVGLAGHRRCEMMLVDQPRDDDGTQGRFNSDSVFLITGGALGITADVAIRLAELYSPTLIITGRTPLPERSHEALESFIAQATLGEQDPRSLKSEIIKDLKSAGEPVTPVLVNERYSAIMKEYKARQNIARMQRLDARVFYHACDCTDDKAFSRLIRQIYQQHQKIDGVIHAAGYLKDALVTQKSVDHFKRVLDTKVEGARILLREIDFEPLDFIIFFSSVAGRFGNQGQADYAAANEILNKMALKLNHQWPGKATAINWGPWEGEGMVSDQVKKQFAEVGIYLLPRSAGAGMLNREINLSDRAAEVVIFGADDIENRLPVIHQPAATIDAFKSLPFMNMVVPVAPTGNHQSAWGLTLDQAAPYLNDHRINGVAVLPAAVAMELMAQAAVAAKPGYQFRGVHEFKLIKGITVNADGPARLTITANAQPNGTQPNVLVDVRLALPEQGSRCNYSARVMLSRKSNGHIPEVPVARHSRRFEQSVEEVYAGRLFHDGVFQGLKAIESFEIADLQNNGIRGVIEPSIPERIIGLPAGGTWLIDPIVFDCAYQLALLWIQESYGMMALPGDMKKYIQYRPYNGGPIHCEVYIKMANFPRLILDFSFTDHAGLLFAQATDVTAIMKKELHQKAADAPILDHPLSSEA